MKQEKILLIEDSPTVQAYFQSMLEAEGFTVITASDGLEAAEKFFRDVPDAVVSDVEMPVMNGYHICRLLKSEPETRPVPFVMLTSLTEARYKYWGLEVGADQYVLKEEGEEKLIPALRQLLEKRSYDPASIRKLGEMYGNSRHILDRLNRMLDEKLFHMTLTHSITTLAFKDISPNDLVRKILEILLHIVHVESISATILDTDEIRFFAHSLEPLTNEYVLDLSQYSVTYLGEHSSIELDLSKLDLECFTELKQRELAFRKEDIHTFFRRISDEVQLGLHLMPVRDHVLQKDSLELVEYLMDILSITIAHSYNQRKIKNLSAIDSLTHLYNRRQFMALLNGEYRRTIRHNLNLSVIFLDIDTFKRVNDTFGHLSGDMVLRALADTIKRTIRTSDVAGRYGGEEFVIYLPETNLQNAAISAERLRKNFEEQNIPIGKSGLAHLTISLGVASIGEVDPADDVDRLIELADKKMYVAKQRGKNRIHF